jgi:pimeloyl-ACP methyl ester carboxylesterase
MRIARVVIVVGFLLLVSGESSYAGDYCTIHESTISNGEGFDFSAGASTGAWDFSYVYQQWTDPYTGDVTECAYKHGFSTNCTGYFSGYWREGSGVGSSSFLAAVTNQYLVPDQAVASNWYQNETVYDARKGIPGFDARGRWVSFVRTHEGLLAAMYIARADNSSITFSWVYPYGRPIVLVRGLGLSSADNPVYWSSLEGALGYYSFRPMIWRCDTINPTASFQSNAASLHSFIQDRLQAYAGTETPKHISVVAHSMGGLITRQYLANGYPESDKIDRVITQSTPHCGSLIADIGAGALKMMNDWPFWGPGLHMLIRTVMPAPFELTQSYCVEKFNPRVTNRRNARFVFAGGTGGPQSNSWVFRRLSDVLGHLPLCLGAGFNDNDGAVTLLSSWGSYRSFPWCQVRNQISSPRAYSFPHDHTGIHGAQMAGFVRDVMMDWPVTADAGVAAQSAAGELSQDEDEQLVAGPSGNAVQGEMRTATVPVDPCSTATFALVGSSLDTLEFSLVDPNGNVIDRNSNGVGVEYASSIEGDSSFQSFVVQAPAPGSWQVRVAGTQVASETGEFGITVTAIGGVRFTVENAYFNSGLSVTLKASLVDHGSPVLNATVQAVAVDSTGASQAVVLLDDGAHNDGAANDGVYAASLAASPGTVNWAGLKAEGTTGGEYSFSRLQVASCETSDGSIAVAGSLTDSGVDEGGKAGYEKLRVTVPVHVAAGGAFSVSGELRTSEGGLIATTSQAYGSLVAGDTTLSLDFQADDVRRSGANGPYKVCDLRLFNESGSEAVIADVMAAQYPTAAYQLSDFADSVPPPPVSDLSIRDITGANAVLAWTAPGDEDGTSVSSYSLRCAQGTAVTVENWDSLSPQPVPEPLSPGSTQTTTIGPLESIGDYCVALRSTDAAGNMSDLSNSVGFRMPNLIPPPSLPDGSSTTILGIMTGPVDADGLAAVQSSDRTWGIVLIVDPTYAGYGLRGRRLLITGGLGSMGHVRTITPSEVTELWDGPGPLPLGMVQKTLGSKPTTIPLLVRCWGRVTQVSPGGAYFYMDDGSALKDGTFTGSVENLGVRVKWPLPESYAGSYAAVSGVSTEYDTGSGSSAPELRPMYDGDVDVVQQGNGSTAGVRLTMHLSGAVSPQPRSKKVSAERIIMLRPRMHHSDPAIPNAEPSPQAAGPRPSPEP